MSNVGDGVALAAGPLLVASQTRSPMLVALAGALQQLPWLIFGLHAGALADRVDRRLLVMACDALRVGALGVLCLVIVTGRVSIGLILATMFAIGVAEVFADTATGTLVPMLVPRADLGVANARLQAGFITANQLAGPPVGAFLFAVGAAVPFAVQAVAVALGVVLVARIGTPPGSVRDPGATHVWRDIIDGVRWVAGHRAVRTLALVILLFNITWGAGWSVLVLYATQRLGTGAVGFGLLTTMIAAGGVLATVSYGWLERRLKLATLMRGCLALEVITHLALAVNHWAWAAMAIMFVFGVYAFVWGTVSQSVRQRAVPTALQGRVSSVYHVGLVGGIVAGQALGGLLATHYGLTAPFWFAFAGSGLTLVVVWRSLTDIAHADSESDDHRLRSGSAASGDPS